MSPPNRLLWIVSLVALGSGCRKEQPAVKAGPATPSVSSAAPAPASSALPAATVAAKPAAPAPAPPARKPTPLDAAGLRTAKTYLAELSAGRRATVAKDYEQAEQHFSKCLAVLPRDPRALAERGYARLRANKLPEAEADLTAARHAAPSSAMLLQILHNLAQVARQRGDERAAIASEDEKKRVKAARRLPSGVTCSSDVTDSDLEPQTASSLGDALEQLLAAHAAEDAVEASIVKFASEPFGSSNEVDQIKELAARGPLPDAGWQLWAVGNTYRNHALIANAGKLYGFPNQSSGATSLCGLEDGAELVIGGGGAHPWYIQRTYRQLVRAYTTDEASGQTMGHCEWASSKIDVTILDSKTFAGIRTLSALAQPTDDGSGQEPQHLLELEWQADKVIVDACGQHSVVPYAP